MRAWALGILTVTAMQLGLSGVAADDAGAVPVECHVKQTFTVAFSPTASAPPGFPDLDAPFAAIYWGKRTTFPRAELVLGVGLPYPGTDGDIAAGCGDGWTGHVAPSKIPHAKTVDEATILTCRTTMAWALSNAYPPAPAGEESSELRLDQYDHRVLTASISEDERSLTFDSTVCKRAPRTARP